MQPADGASSAEGDLPLVVALFSGEISAAIVALLTNLDIPAAQRAIAAWIAAGDLTTARSPNKLPRVRPVVRERALAEATPRQRRRAYEALARAFDDDISSDSALLDVARYFRNAAYPALAVARYLNVAERQLDRADYNAATAVLAEAAGALTAMGPQLIVVLELQARCAVATGDHPGALSVLERLRRVAAACGDRLATVRALLETADLNIALEAHEAAIDAASTARESLGGADESRESIEATLILAEALDGLGHTEAARLQLREALTMGAAGQRAVTARLLRVRGQLRDAGDLAEAADDFRAALAAATTALDFPGTIRAARRLAAAQRENADLYSAAATLRGGLRIAERNRLRAAALPLTVDLIDLSIEAGRYPEARELVTAAVTAAAPAAALRAGLVAGDDALIAAAANRDAVEDALASANPRRIGAVIPVFCAFERGRGEPAAAHALYRRAIHLLERVTAPVEFWCDAAEFCAEADLEPVRVQLAAAATVATPLRTLLVEFGTLALERRRAADPAALAPRAATVAQALLTAGFRDWARRAGALAGRERSPA